MQRDTWHTAAGMQRLQRSVACRSTASKRRKSWCRCGSDDPVLVQMWQALAVVAWLARRRDAAGRIHQMQRTSARPCNMRPRPCALALAPSPMRPRNLQPSPMRSPAPKIRRTVGVASAALTCPTVAPCSAAPLSVKRQCTTVKSRAAHAVSATRVCASTSRTRRRYEPACSMTWYLLCTVRIACGASALLLPLSWCACVATIRV